MKHFIVLIVLCFVFALSANANLFHTDDGFASASSDVTSEEILANTDSAFIWKDTIFVFAYVFQKEEIEDNVFIEIMDSVLIEVIFEYASTVDYEEKSFAARTQRGKWNRYVDVSKFGECLEHCVLISSLYFFGKEKNDSLPQIFESMVADQLENGVYHEDFIMCEDKKVTFLANKYGDVPRDPVFNSIFSNFEILEINCYFYFEYFSEF